jgi:hypothetical protein
MSLATATLNPPNQLAQGGTGETQSANTDSQWPQWGWETIFLWPAKTSWKVLPNGINLGKFHIKSTSTSTKGLVGNRIL